MKNQKIKLEWPLVGNGHIIKYLEKVLVNSASDDSSASGTYVFCGPKDLGKSTIAHYFAKSLMCEKKSSIASLPCNSCSSCKQFQINSADPENRGIIHSDLHIVEKDSDKKNISIEQIRDFIRRLSMSSFLNSYKIGIIKNAETLSEEAANSLLKTTEEPRNKVAIILLATDLEAMPATIISRSQILRFHPVAVDIIHDFLVKEHKAPRSIAKNAAHLSSGRPALALKFFQDKEFYQNNLDTAKIFLEIIRKDTNERLEITDTFTKGKVAGQIIANKTLAILDNWQILVRDLLLLANNQVEIVQFSAILSDLNVIKNRFRVSDLLNIARNLESAKKYIIANVNPKTVLENFVINI